MDYKGEIELLQKPRASLDGAELIQLETILAQRRELVDLLARLDVRALAAGALPPNNAELADVVRALAIGATQTLDNEETRKQNEEALKQGEQHRFEEEWKKLDAALVKVFEAAVRVLMSLPDDFPDGDAAADECDIEEERLLAAVAKLEADTFVLRALRSSPEQPTPAIEKDSEEYPRIRLELGER